MRRRALRTAAALAAVLIVASMAQGWLFDQPSRAPEEASPGEARDPEGAQAASANASHDHDGEPAAADGADLERHRPRHDHALAGGEGPVPTRAQASEFEHQFEDFRVEGAPGLARMADEGYVDGSGTLEDPYVIERFRVEDDLRIEDVDSPLVIRNSYVEGQLTLNFVGEEVYVHHNHVYDLRVNENVERDGPTTAGLFEHNEIEFIGQLRHFGGTFRHNDVGPRPDGVVDTYLSDSGPADLPDEVVWNFDGYHLAHVHNNTVVGRTDVQLHGHFHGSCNACLAHDHADPGDFPPDNEASDERAPDSRHSYRHHTLDFENNTIRAPEARTAVRFLDEGHAGDDQTAASEPNAHLEDRHEHHQYLSVRANEVRRGRLFFDVLNADDARHEGLVQEARVDLVNNVVTRERPRDVDRLIPAFEVEQADNAQLEARGNQFAFRSDGTAAPEGYGWVVEGEPADTTGFLLQVVNASHTRIAGTSGHNATYGVTLDDVRDNSPVRLVDNRFRAEEGDRHDA